MTRDEIIRLANEVGYPLVSIGGNPYIPPLLAALLEAAVEAEREACAKLCEEFEDATDRLNRPSGYECADAIRARGEK